MSLLSNSHIGRTGEQLAVEWLRQRGYLIRDLNWRCGRYEIDIVAERLGVVHFVEVKSRSLSGYATAEDSIDAAKREAMIKAARLYYAQHNLSDEVQFDLIAVEQSGNGEVSVRYVDNIVVFRW